MSINVKGPCNYQIPITFITENTCWLKIGTTKWRSGRNFFGIVWSFTYIWWVLLQSLKMIIVKAISTCFVKFSVIENASIHKSLTILAKSVQVYIAEPCFLKLSKIFFNTLKSVLTVALFVTFCRSYNFFWFIILAKHAFRPFRFSLNLYSFSRFTLTFRRRRSNKFEFAL